MPRKKSEYLEIKTKITFDIYKQYAYFGVYRLTLKKHDVIFIPSLLLAVMLIQIVIGFNPYITGIVILIAIMFIALIIITNKQAKKYYETGKNIIEEETTYKFKDKNMELKTKNSMSKISYDELYYLRETNNALYLYINAYQAYLFDKNQVGEDNFNKLKILLLEKIDNKKYKYYK